jgi:hypothetical protein
MELEASMTLVGLHEPTDFTSLKVVASRPSHVWVTREQLTTLAGNHADDPSWREGLEKMVAYAKSRGWVSEDGAVRAHVEWS